jgi:hypothetical protein
MAISILVFCGQVAYPGWHVDHSEDFESDIEVKPFPSRPLTQACFIASGFAASLLLISALWQNVSAAAAGSTISYTTYGTTKAHVGPVAMVLLWLAFLALTLVSVGLLLLILSLRVLSELSENSDHSDYGYDTASSDEGSRVSRRRRVYV